MDSSRCSKSGARWTWAAQFEDVKPTAEDVKKLGTQRNETLPSYEEYVKVQPQQQQQQHIIIQEQVEAVVVIPKPLPRKHVKVVTYEKPNIVSHGLKPKKK